MREQREIEMTARNRKLLRTEMKRVMRERRLTIKDVSEGIDFGYATLCYFFRNENSKMSAARIIEICQFLSIPVDEVLKQGDADGKLYMVKRGGMYYRRSVEKDKQLIHQFTNDIDRAKRFNRFVLAVRLSNRFDGYVVEDVF